MENINNTIKGVKDLKYKLKVAYEEAKKDPYFKELTDSINLSDDELMKHTSLFERLVIRSSSTLVGIASESAFLASAVSVRSLTYDVTAGRMFFLAISIIVRASMLICLE